MLIDLAIFSLAVFIGYLLRHVQNPRRAERSLNRAERALDQPCPRCGIERWRATQAFVIPDEGIESRCICSYAWPNVLLTEKAILESRLRLDSDLTARQAQPPPPGQDPPRS